MKRRLAVLVLCGPGVGTASLSMEEFYRRMVLAIQRTSVSEYRIFLSCNPGPGEEFCRQFATTHKHVEVYVPPVQAGDNSITDTGAGRYVYGLEYAAQWGDAVVEIDAEGAHNPSEGVSLINAVVKNGKRAAFSTRFSMGGKDYYPFQRRLASIGVTVMSNLLLSLGRFMPDMASGFECFDSRLLLEIFRRHPAKEWITLRTTTALIQTELRACVLWHLGQLGGGVIHREVQVFPITYGKEKVGKNFPSAVGLKALSGFIELVRYRKEFLNTKP